MPVSNLLAGPRLFLTPTDPLVIMIQEYAPWAAYKTLWYLLGRGEMTSKAVDNSLYPNDYQLYGDAAANSQNSGQKKLVRVGQHEL